MPVATPVYAIIIPAYNEAEELPVTLAAVRRAMAAQDLPGECIVVDNHSSDDTAAVAKAGGADRVVFEPVNQIARARNAGAAATEAEYLVFVDADTRIEAALLTRALHLLRDGRCVGGGAVVLFEGETTVGRSPGPRSVEADFPVYPHRGRQFFVLPPRRLPGGRRFRSQALCRRRSAAVTPTEKMGPRPRAEVYHHHRIAGLHVGPEIALVFGSADHRLDTLHGADAVCHTFAPALRVLVQAP